MEKHTRNILIGSGLIATTTLLALIIHRSQSKARGASGGSLPSSFDPSLTNWYGQKSILSNAPRGIRNNNPGNLIKTKIAWNGKVPNAKNTDGKFEQFIAPEYGVRALIKDLLSDFKKGKNTVSQLIKEFAPIYENNTKAYIQSVSDFVGVNSGTRLKPSKNTIQRLVMAIDRVENGAHFITQGLFEKAYLMI
jgi:hypothetical protein